MKIIKKLNNNVAIGIDSNSHECVVFGKGIGFLAMPYELTDLSKIDRTYYDVDRKYLGLLEEIPEEIFEVSAKIVEKAKIKLDCDLSPNLLFTLADHLNFALERLKKGIDIRNPLSYDIEHLYSMEMSVGYKAVEYIKEKLKVNISKSEAVSIAMHLVNAEADGSNMDETIRNTNVLKDITEIVECTMAVKIDENGFEYSRFIMHMRYLMKRRKSNLEISSDNKMMFDLMKVKYTETYKCVTKIDKYFMEKLDWQCGEEELLYLMLHINRLCANHLK